MLLKTVYISGKNCTYAHGIHTTLTADMFVTSCYSM